MILPNHASEMVYLEVDGAYITKGPKYEDTIGISGLIQLIVGKRSAVWSIIAAIFAFIFGVLSQKLLHRLGQ